MENPSDDHMNLRRYFIVHFTGLNKKKEQQRGKIHMFVENDGYVNERFLHEAIEEKFGLKDPYIDRVEELDEPDFHDFIAEEPRKHNLNNKKDDDLNELI